MDYTQDPAYQDLFKRIYGNSMPGGGSWNQQNTTSKLGGMGDQFSGMFRNMVGRDPTSAEMNSMFQSVGGQVGGSSAGFSGTDYSGMQNIMNPYIQNTYGKDITANQTSQQQTQLQGAQQQIQDLIQKQVGATASDLTNPNSPTYQAFSGQMNNLGISPSSGAFQAGLGGTLGQSASNDISAALGGVSLPQISGQMQTAQQPYQMAMGQMYPGLASYGDRNSSLYDFNLQSDFGQRMFDQMQPSGFEKDLGYANTASGILKNVTGSAQSAQAMGGATWICTAMKKHQVLGGYEVKRLHKHLFKVFFSNFWKFMGYFALGQLVVWFAEKSRVEWDLYRPLFYDRVIAEPDPSKALALYEDAFWTLVRDIRVKYAFVYDKPSGCANGSR